VDILAELRSSTAERHAAIESVVPLMGDDVAWVDYESYLRSFLGFLEPLEQRLQQVPGLKAALPDLEQRFKTPLLQADLEGIPVTRCARLPKLDSLASAMGVLYVLEGSTLGGQVLLRHLTEQFGAGFPHAFLASYGSNTGAMWKAFGGYVRAAVVTPHDRALAIAAANETFALLHQWLEVNSSERSLVAK
jgi:heme oxygenase